MLHACQVSLSLYLDYHYLLFVRLFSNHRSNYNYFLLPFCGFCTVIMPDAMAHTLKDNAVCSFWPENIKLKNVSGNCFAFFLKAQGDAVPTCLFLKRAKDFVNNLLHMPPVGNYCKYSIVTFCVRCESRLKSQREFLLLLEMSQQPNYYLSSMNK